MLCLFRGLHGSKPTICILDVFETPVIGMLCPEDQTEGKTHSCMQCKSRSLSCNCSNLRLHRIAWRSRHTSFSAWCGRCLLLRPSIHLCNMHFLLKRKGMVLHTLIDIRGKASFWYHQNRLEIK